MDASSYSIPVGRACYWKIRDSPLAEANVLFFPLLQSFLVAFKGGGETSRNGHLVRESAFPRRAASLQTSTNSAELRVAELCIDWTCLASIEVNDLEQCHGWYDSEGTETPACLQAAWTAENGIQRMSKAW